MKISSANRTQDCLITLLNACAILIMLSVVQSCSKISQQGNEVLEYPLHQNARHYWNQGRYQFVVEEEQMKAFLIDASNRNEIFSKPLAFGKNGDSVYFLGQTNYGIIHTSTACFETYSTISNMPPRAQEYFRSFNDVPREGVSGIDLNKTYNLF